MGKVLIRGKASYTTQLNINKLTNGTYFVKVGEGVRKFIKW